MVEAPDHLVVKDVFRSSGFGAFLFSGEFSKQDEELVGIARNLHPGISSSQVFVVQMRSEFRVGNSERSLSCAKHVLNLTDEGSKRNLTALNCRVYLEVELGLFEDASRSLEKYLAELAKKQSSDVPSFPMLAQFAA